MTYREWITATIARFEVGISDIELILVNQKKLIPDPDLDVDVATAKTALCKEFANLIPLTREIREGGYSISWNLDAIELWYNQTCAELGLIPVGKDKITDRSNAW
jgi:hypothetical protein